MVRDGKSKTPQGKERLPPWRQEKRLEVFVEDKGSSLSGTFMNAMAQTLKAEGLEVTRDLASGSQNRADLAIVWNGRDHLVDGPTIFIEHGWLPRWRFQVSSKGINADSHLSPFEWDGRTPSDEESETVRLYLESLRTEAPDAFSHKKVPPVEMFRLPERFLLVPLQMEWDPNVYRHTPNRLRRMQYLMEHIAQIDPNLPVIYKQHPADVRRGNQQLGMDPGRAHDLILPHREANVHQFLKSGCCKGIVALTSDVVHDGLWWDVPSVTLGRNIWPDTGASPFLGVLPKDWRTIQEFFRITRPCRVAYIRYLMEHQWQLVDATNGKKVRALLEAVLRDQKTNLSSALSAAIRVKRNGPRLRKPKNATNQSGGNAPARKKEKQELTQ